MMPAVLFSQCAACVVVLSSGDAAQCVACVACLENRVMGCYSGIVDTFRVFACAYPLPCSSVVNSLRYMLHYDIRFIVVVWWGCIVRLPARNELRSFRRKPFHICRASKAGSNI